MSPVLLSLEALIDVSAVAGIKTLLASFGWEEEGNFNCSD
jgi:hypothetical protein